MHGNRKAHHRNAGSRQIVAIAVALTMLCSLLPAYVFAGGLSVQNEYLCGHTHDDTCNYSSAGYEVSCKHCCDIISFNDDIPGTVNRAYQAESGESYASICSELPDSLPGKIACAEHEVSIPVRWSCDAFTGEPGTYIFRAELTNENCACSFANNDSAGNTDGGMMPFVTVTVPQVYAYSVSHPIYPVTVSGSDEIPDDARLVVKEVALSDAQTLLGDDGATPLFAYDIKLMTGGKLDEKTGQYVGETEYQPTAENPVTVTVNPPEPIEVPVEVIHIAEDKSTGEVTQQTVKNVVTTHEGAVEFPADGFSVFVVRVYDSSKTIHNINFPIGDYTVEYSTNETTGFQNLTSTTVTLGASSTPQYDTIYFKINECTGFDVGVVTASSGSLTLINATANLYSLNVLSATATIDITIPVTGIKITGTPTTGGTLSVTPSENLISQTFEYEWYLCERASGDFNAITGMSSSTLELTDSAYDNKYIQVMATDGANTYYSAAVGPVTTDGMIIFDLSKGCVEIGYTDNGSKVYRGYNSTGAIVTGVHNDNSEYKVMQSNNTTVTSNRITLTGYTPMPKYDITLSGVNCDTVENKSKGGIIANAIVSTPMEIIIRLEGDNLIGRLHYATGEANSESVSSLKITSSLGDGNTAGSLTAYSSASWSAAIGGIDDGAYEASRNITIAGGTITATTYGTGHSGTSAIGGGGNGASDILITGGIINATNCGTGATLGGGGGETLSGAPGYVTITGGTITATNRYANGVAIGSGGSKDSVGSDALVTITGGTITTSGNIGGGYSTNSTGGNATISISGGNVKVMNGSIGGGNSELGTGGNVTVNITGGTVSTPHISGGYSGATGIYKDASVSIAAASVNIEDRSNITSVTVPNPSTGSEVVVYSQEININELSGYTGDSTDTVIQSAGLTDGFTYPLTDVFSDEDSKIYFWLPTEYNIVGLTINGQYYLVEGAQTQSVSITHDGSTVGSVFGAVLNYGEPVGFCWQISDNGTDNWSDIAGATSNYYTAVSADLNKYIRVIITTSASVPITSENVLITPTPHASIIYSALHAGCTLTAQFLNATAVSHQWQYYDSAAATWQNITSATNATYIVANDDDGKQLRVRISDGTNIYSSSYVVIHNPTYTVIIPDNTTITSKNGSFPITAERKNFAQSHSLTVTCSGDYMMDINGHVGTTLGYTLFTDAGLHNAVINNGSVAAFSGNGNNTIPIYYSVNNPVYSGTYTDTLTFTVTFNTGS